MNNLKELRSIVRNIISERFEGGIKKGLFQSVSDKGYADSSSSAFDSKEKSSLYPFVIGGSIKNIPEYEKAKKKVDLKIQEKNKDILNKDILNDDEFKKMNEKYLDLFRIFLDNDNKRVPTGLESFNDNIKNPFFKKNPSLLSIPEVKIFYGIK